MNRERLIEKMRMIHAMTGDILESVETRSDVCIDTAAMNILRLLSTEIGEHMLQAILSHFPDLPNPEKGELDRVLLRALLEFKIEIALRRSTPRWSSIFPNGFTRK